MTSISEKELFEKYYQKTYDFNTTELTSKEVYEIKRLVREKRVDYAKAPIGDQIFNYIIEKENAVSFELVSLKNNNVDGMLYIPKMGNDKAYIIINENKPLVNQIFAATHEYYHYIKDYEEIKRAPYICKLSSLSTRNEKKASRFAAEFLLPEDALRDEIDSYYRRFGKKREKSMNFADTATCCITLTLKYQMPLKAVLYRLYEEHYIADIDAMIERYEFVKGILWQIDICQELVQYLYSNNNSKIRQGETSLYTMVKEVYQKGLVSRQTLMEDAELLGLDEKLIEIVTEDEVEEEDTEEIRLPDCNWEEVFNANDSGESTIP